MPKPPPASSTVIAVSRASCAARWVCRSTGSAPRAVNQVLVSHPRIPVPVKYSALARYPTRRGDMRGMAMLSMKDRWLLAMMNGPVAGTFSRPRTCGRKSSRNSGRRMNREMR